MNLVEQIKDAMNGVIQVELPDYTLLDYKYDIEKNDLKGNKRRFGVVPSAGSKADSITRQLTINHDFQVILTQDYVKSDVNDDDLESQLMGLYDKFDELGRALHARKAGLPSVVLLVDFLSIEEPEIFDDNSVVALRATFTVRYRNNLQ